MKLVWVAPTDRGGGVIWVADSCCRQAAADGFDAHLLTLEPLAVATQESVTYPVHSLDVDYPYTDTPARFLAWIEQEKPDVIILNNVDALDICIPYLPPEVRCIYAIHDTRRFYHAAAVKYEESLDAVIAVSRATGSRFRQKLRHPERLHVVLNGTQFPVRSHSCLPRTDLVFLGGSDARKGAFDVLQLWPRLVSLGFKGQLHWYGRTESIEQQILDLPETNRIIVHGHVPRAEVMGRLESAKVFLMPSRGEACSIAALESMAMGCIPVAWDIELTGIKEIVPSACRFIAPLGNFDAMAHETMRALLCGDDIGDSLSATMRSAFTEERMWRDYRQVIHGLGDKPLAVRSRVGQSAPAYSPPLRASHLIPRPLWIRVRPHVARSARIYYFLRKLL